MLPANNSYTSVFETVASECQQRAATVDRTQLAKDTGALTKQRGVSCFKATESEWSQIGAIVVLLASTAIAAAGIYFLCKHMHPYMNPSTWSSCATGGAAVATLIGGGGLVAAGVAGVCFSIHSLAYFSERGRKMLEKLGCKALGFMNQEECDKLRGKIKNSTLKQLHEDPDWRVRNLDIIVRAALLEQATSDQYLTVITLMAKYAAVTRVHQRKTDDVQKSPSLCAAEPQTQLDTAYNQYCAGLEQAFKAAKDEIWPPVAASQEA